MNENPPAGLKHPAVPFVAPFAVFIGCLALERAFEVPGQVLYPLRFVLVLATILVFSRNVVSLKPSHPWWSIALGVAVFFIWVGPDLLWPGYRGHWLFQNAITGKAASTIPAATQNSPVFILVRAAGSILLVPYLEELFWRGWLMRWLIQYKFWAIPIGTFTPYAFWLVAVLFASEHGPYWEVGLVAGIAFNWWAMRTRNLADCILAHGVTNACLAWFVVYEHQWQYWL